jgi:hypothetical protein
MARWLRCPLRGAGAGASRWWTHAPAPPGSSPARGPGAAYPALSWAPSSGWLFFRAGGARVKAYLPGTARAVALHFRLPRASAPLTG